MQSGLNAFTYTMSPPCFYNAIFVLRVRNESELKTPRSGLSSKKLTNSQQVFEN